MICSNSKKWLAGESGSLHQVLTKIDLDRSFLISTIRFSRFWPGIVNHQVCYNLNSTVCHPVIHTRNTCLQQPLPVLRYCKEDKTFFIENINPIIQFTNYRSSVSMATTTIRGRLCSRPLNASRNLSLL
jgi:hypothetical protein